MRILVAGVGNVLKGDDGFGVRAAQALQKDSRLTADTTALAIVHIVATIHLQPHGPTSEAPVERC